MTKKSLILIIIAIVVSISIPYYYWSIKPSGEEIKDPLLRKIKEQGKITIGMDATYPPMESIDEQGNFIGMDIDIAKEIAQDLGVRPEFQNIIWEELFETVRQGRVDMIISSITITSERAKTMAFSDPYFNAGQVIVTKIEKAGTIKGVEDLEGRKIGVQIETTSEAEAKKYTAPDLVISYENYDLAKAALSEGAIDAIIIDYPAGIGMVNKENEFIIIGQPFTQEFYGIATQIDQKPLLSELNKTIRRLKQEGKFKELEEKWLTK